MKEKITQIVETYVRDGVLVIPMKSMRLTDQWRMRQWEEERLPNLHRVRDLFGAVIDELCALGDTDGGRKIFRVVFDYTVSETRKYAQDAQGYSWTKYASIFDAGSPCCMCDAQSTLSTIASRNGFDDLAHYVVSVHCPASPSDYRREASTYASEEDEWKKGECKRRHLRNVELLASWDGPIFNYLWTESHTRNR